MSKVIEQVKEIAQAAGLSSHQEAKIVAEVKAKERSGQ